MNNATAEAEVGSVCNNFQPLAMMPQQHKLSSGCNKINWRWSIDVKLDIKLYEAYSHWLHLFVKCILKALDLEESHWLHLYEVKLDIEGYEACRPNRPSEQQTVTHLC